MVTYTYTKHDQLSQKSIITGLLKLPSPALGQVWVDAQLQYHTSESESIQVFLPKITHRYVPRQSNPKLQANEIIWAKNI